MNDRMVCDAENNKQQIQKLIDENLELRQSNNESKRKYSIEAERRERICELYTKETSILLDRCNKLEGDFTAKDNELTATRHALEMRCCELQTSFQDVQDMYNETNLALQIFENSKCVKLVKVYWRLKDRIHAVLKGFKIKK